MAEEFVIVGAGGSGSEAVDLVNAINLTAQEPVWDLLGVLDDQSSKQNLDLLVRQGVPYVGTVDSYIGSASPCAHVVGVGSPGPRPLIAEGMDGAGFAAVTLVYPHATLGADMSIGSGTVGFPGARLSTDAQAGCHVHVDANATVGDDTILGDFVRLNPASPMSDDCVIWHEALVGAGAAVINSRRGVQRATIGAGPCVPGDVVVESIVKGAPAR